MARRHPKRGKQLDHYGTGQGLFLRDEIPVALGYRVLSAVEKLVLMEWLRTYGKASHGDTVDLGDTGVLFTFSQVREDVAESSFKRARRRLIQIGWFQSAPHLKPLRPGAPNRYLPSTDWRAYEPTAAESAALRKRTAVKAASLKRARCRRADFCVQNLKAAPGKTE